MSYTCIGEFDRRACRERRIWTLRLNSLAKLPISVLIDTYNHERFIEKALNSVLEQDFPVAAYSGKVVLN